MEKEYGRLTIIGPVKVKGRTQYRCRCRCGKITVVFKKNLVTGRTVSCGCYKAELATHWFK